MVEICNGSKSVIFPPKYQAQRCSYLTARSSKNAQRPIICFAVLVKGHLSPCNKTISKKLDTLN